MFSSSSPTSRITSASPFQSTRCPPFAPWEKSSRRSAHWLPSALAGDPGHMKTLFDALAAAAETRHGFIYIGDDGRERRQPYHELLSRAIEVGGALQKTGLSPGEVVVIILPDAEQFLT